MQNKYLETLELSPGATKQEIKKAYRRLSKKYHPDMSKDEHAKEKFIALTEAYDFLKRVGPSPHQEPIRYDYDTFVDEYKLRREAIRKNAAQKTAWEAKTRRSNIYRSAHYLFLFVGFFILLHTIIISIDRFLPHTLSEHQVLNYFNANPISQRKAYVSLRGFSISFERNYKSLADYRGMVTVYTSPLLKVPTSLTINHDGQVIYYLDTYTIFNLSMYFVPILYLLFALYFFVLKNPDHKLTIAMTIVTFFFIEIVFYANLAN